MGFCKSVHTLWGIAADGDEAPRRCWGVQPPGGEGLRLMAAEAFAGPSSEKVDPGARGLQERCCYDGGLELCTESLGSESGDGALEPEEEAALEASAAVEEEEEQEEDNEEERWGRRKREQRREFPPPLQWMSGGDGRRTAFMRAERRDGRLVLTEVRIEQPEVFRASRESGRLRLHLICPVDRPEEETESDTTAEEETPAAAEEAEWSPEERSGWRRVEWLRRCQEAVSGNHEVSLWWNHHRSFVTTA